MTTAGAWCRGLRSCSDKGDVNDFRAEKRLVYMKDINFDADGNPVILVVTAAFHQPGPIGDPRIWTIAHWDGKRWQFHEVTRWTGNYDMGSLYVEGDTWRIIGPTEPGPQRYGTGGEVDRVDQPRFGRDLDQGARRDLRQPL